MQGPVEAETMVNSDSAALLARVCSDLILVRIVTNVGVAEGFY